MSLSLMNWASEKVKLRFQDGPRLSQIRMRWPNANPGSFVGITEMTFEDRVIGSSEAMIDKSAESIMLSLNFEVDAQESEFLRRSLMRVSLLRIEELGESLQLPIVLVNSDSMTQEELKAFGFSDLNICETLRRDAENVALRTALKKELRAYSRIATKVGRGYLLDAERINPKALLELNSEYGEVAWGLTNWARNSELSADEKRIIEDLPRNTIGLEVGAGSGRVTSFLKDHVLSLVATDIVSETLHHVNSLGQNVTAVCDDIVNTKLNSESFDVAMFWENGLGAILNLEDRGRAVSNMANLLKPGGVLILAVRQLLEISTDQLMIAAQTDRVMGIYHTFGEAEMRGYQTSELVLEKIEIGDSRPAGGHERFYFYRKVHA